MRALKRKSRRITIQWTVDKVLKLIKAIEYRPLLWDPSNEDYKKKTLRLLLWKEIEAEVFRYEVSADEANKKWQSLRSQYKDYLTRGIANRRKNADYETKWQYFNKLQFLSSTGAGGVRYEDGIPNIEMDLTQEDFTQNDFTQQEYTRPEYTLQSLSDASQTPADSVKMHIEPDQTSSMEPPKKKQKRRIDDKYFKVLDKTTRVLSKLGNHMEDQNPNQYSQSIQNFGNFVMSLLTEIEDDEIQLETQQKITEVCYMGKGKWLKLQKEHKKE